MSAVSWIICFSPRRKTGWSSAISILSIEILPTCKGNTHRDPRSLARSAADSYLTTPEAGAFAHTDKAKSPWIENLVFFNAFAVIADFQGDTACSFSEAHTDAGRLGMSSDVRQRLLADAEDRGGAIAVQNNTFRAGAELRFDVGTLAEF